MNLLEIKENKNLKTEFSGIDSLDPCVNKEHFKNYNKKISYEYNAQGFRDKEWPTDLKNKIWCIGDSFTVGVGQPAEETWPALLEKELNERCINISQDGCSNDLIAARAKQVIEKFQPTAVIIMWSYFWRRFINGKNVHYDAGQRELPSDDIDNFLKNLFAVNDSFKRVINLTIPDCFIEDSSTRFKILKVKNKKNFKKVLNLVSDRTIPDIIEVEQVDYARDSHHFDILTSQNIVKQILENLQ